MKSPFILAGRDFEGETREISFSTIERARALAVEVMSAKDGPPWQDFAIWGNDPATEEWRALETSE